MPTGDTRVFHVFSVTVTADFDGMVEDHLADGFPGFPYLDDGLLGHGFTGTSADVGPVVGDRARL